MDEKKLIEIFDEEGHWVGNGTVDKYGGIECSAVLRPDNEDNYDRIEEDIREGKIHGKVDVYTWAVRERL